MRPLLVTVLVAGALLAPTAAVGATADLAASCGSNTTINMELHAYGGQFHKWAANSYVGINLLNANHQRVEASGAVITDPARGYSVQRPYINSQFDSPGARSAGVTTLAPICASSATRLVYFELYPRKKNGYFTTHQYLGSAIVRAAITPGHAYTFNLRLPTRSEHGGNTGQLVGELSYHGKSIPAANLSLMVWPEASGTACGVHGWSAGADITTSVPTGHTLYRFDAIAGGQCYAPSQRYMMWFTCTSVCGAAGVKVIRRNVPVISGRDTRMDITAWPS